MLILNSTKFLGVLVDSKFTWKEQITAVHNKVAKSIGILNKVKVLLETPVLLTLYYTLIMPYLNYCSIVWGNTYTSNLSSLYLLQKRALRIVTKVGYYEHTKPLFYDYKLLNIYDNIELNTLLFMYNAFTEKLPINIQQYFNRSNASLYNRSKYNFQVQYRRTTLKSMCVSHKGVNLWNNLSNDLKMSSSYVIF